VYKNKIEIFSLSISKYTKHLGPHQRNIVD